MYANKFIIRFRLSFIAARPYFDVLLIALMGYLLVTFSAMINPIPPQSSEAGNIILITGGTNGIGLSSVKMLAERGATVLLCSRDLVQGRDIASRIDVPGKVIPIPMDMANLTSVARVSRFLRNRLSKIDKMILNAGVVSPPDANLTDDGFEQGIQVNHLSHYLLTRILMGDDEEVSTKDDIEPINDDDDYADLSYILKETHYLRTTSKAFSKPKRIIVVSSGAALHADELGIDSFTYPIRKYWVEKGSSYTRSKLCNILFAKQLNKIYGLNNVDNVVDVVNEDTFFTISLHPGAVYTKMTRDNPPFTLMFESKIIGLPSFIRDYIFMPWDRLALYLTYRSADQGAYEIVYWTTAPSTDIQLHSGEFAYLFRPFKMAGDILPSINNETLAEHTWNISENYILKYLKEESTTTPPSVSKDSST
eukprot:TRINITY_DN2300_c0_g2_i2.p1 TRINITY_DN2300_c0_g2~~TRINITY_DN2300_c0_g2_i2.p1  ORF type:complete len:485 (-),score=76.96 TRINITY_DN2300_c0_g2_i2:407-1672(-)